MAESKSTEQPVQLPKTIAQRAKRAGLYVLFGTILFIPRIRRLRRRVWAWTLVRLGVAAVGVWLIWRYAHLRSGTGAMGMGLLLLAFGLLVRARPVKKSVDEVAKELGALIVLNGGAFVASLRTRAVRKCQLFIHSEEVIVCDPRHRPIEKIAFAKFRGLVVRPSADGKGKKHHPWEVEIALGAEGARAATFVYEGPFAEHLAQVAESTLRDRWKKGLPVLP